jgi:predicted ester cyclase
MSSHEANKALVRRVFEEVITSGDAATMRTLVMPDFLDHDPLPGQPPGADGAEYVVRTMHGAHPDLRFTVDDLIAEGDRVTIRWTLHATNTGPLFGREPTGLPVEYAAIVIFRIADGLIAERWAGWKPGFAPTSLPPWPQANRSPQPWQRPPAKQPTTASPERTRARSGAT